MPVANPGVISTPLVDPATGRITQPWLAFFQGKPGPVVAIEIVSNPQSFTAPSNGLLAVDGGTVSSITITRGKTIVPTGAFGGLIPLQQDDIATVTFSSGPVLNFLPNA